MHYLTGVFLPALAACGISVRLELRRWGWYPKGGGEIGVDIVPARRIAGLTATQAAAPPTVTGLSAVSRLPRSIAERQRHQAESRLEAAGVRAEIALEEDTTALSPGTLLFLAVPGRAGFSALGRRGVPAEQVANAAVDALLDWRSTGALIDEHLADQLVPFLGSPRVRPPSSARDCPSTCEPSHGSRGSSCRSASRCATSGRPGSTSAPLPEHRSHPPQPRTRSSPAWW